VTETAYETLGKAWPSNHVTQGKTVTRFYITYMFNMAALSSRCIFCKYLLLHNILRLQGSCPSVTVISQVHASAIQYDYTDSSPVTLFLHILALQNHVFTFYHIGSHINNII
jgi:hypothetical protein